MRLGKSATKFGQLGGLMHAADILYACNGFPHGTGERLAQLIVPDAWLQRALDANAQSTHLALTKLHNVVPNNEIDVDLADPNDNALEVLCDGEDSVQQLIVMHANCHALHEVLNALFEGDLSVAVEAG